MGIVIFGVVLVFLFAAACSMDEWMRKEGRVFRPVLWYQKWNRAKGNRCVFMAKVAVRKNNPNC